jgi:fructan beta-fructosidase
LRRDLGNARGFSRIGRGRSFTDFEGNPVVKHSGRDPKLIWYAPGRHWVMAVFDQQEQSRGIAFYTSADLKAWQFQSRIDGFYECPEIFEAPVDGSRKDTRWVVYAASGDYSVGAFDGKTFTAESGKHPFNRGNCFYASQTFNNIPAEDGRRIQIAWGRIPTPGMPFNQCMLFPVELTLRTTDEGLRLFAEPVREIETLRARKHAWTGETLQAGAKPLAGVEGDLFDLRADFEAGDAAEFGINVRGTPVTYDARGQQLLCKGCKAPLKPEGGRVRLRILLDRTSIEVYANGGRIYMPVGVIHPDDNRSIEVLSTGGATKVNLLEVWELKPAWQ